LVVLRREKPRELLESLFAHQQSNSANPWSQMHYGICDHRGVRSHIGVGFGSFHIHTGTLHVERATRLLAPLRHHRFLKHLILLLYI